MTRATASPPLSIAVLGPYRHPIREPHAGGLEAVVDQQVRGLRRRGHRVALFAAAGSDGHETDHEFPGELGGDDGRYGDVGYPPGGRERETAEFHRVLDEVGRREVDVVLNHALHPAPLERAADLPAPMLTILHCPAFPEMADPLARLGAAAGRVMAVSSSVRSTWRIPQGATVLHNGVDTGLWKPGGTNAEDEAGPAARIHGAGRPGPLARPVAVWVGRMVPEKAPHLAVLAAAEAGMDLVVVGRAADAGYVRTRLEPALTRAAAAGVRIRQVGALDRRGVARIVAAADVALVTPDWEEPFGLTGVEALCCGTPVVAIARGGVAEVLRGRRGVRLVPPPRLRPGSRESASGTDRVVSALAAAASAAVDTTTVADRAAIAEEAARAFSLERHLERLERSLIATASAGSLASIGATG